jgi:mRNA-degrading endonuclease RelE of RelBE toxin-antitoxin system
MYSLSIQPEACKIFDKLLKKNKAQLEIIDKKIIEIQTNPHHKYKHLKTPLQNFYRVHLDTHFVLIFKINHEESNIEIYYFTHHDEAYKWRPN